MAERRQPDYDFFGPGQGQPGGGSGRTPPPQGQPPQGRWTPAPAPPRPPAEWPSMYGPQTPGRELTTPPPRAFMVPRRSTGLTVLVVAAAVVTTIVVLGVIGAIAVPVFLAQSMRAEWKATTYALPRTFDGADRTEVPQAAVPDLSAQTFGPLQIGSYRAAGTAYVVVAGKGKQPLTDEDQLGFRRQFASGMAQNGLSLSLAEKDAGKLGGWFGCGAMTNTTVTACLATDRAGVVVVLVTGSQDPATGSRRLREAVEKR